MNKQFSEMTVAELRAYAEMVQAEYEADEISGVSGRQIVRDAWARVREAERIERQTALPQSTINVAVSSIANSIELGEHAAARQTAEHITAKIAALGGKTWTNPYWYGCDVTPNVGVPTGRYGDRTFEYVKWPAAQVGDVVEFENAQFRVVANWASSHRPGEWTRQFSFYAIMPV